MKVAHDKQKSYADARRRPLEFDVGDMVYLKVSVWKHMLWFGMKEKLASRYIGYFKVVKRIGQVAYKLVLPSYLAKIHDVFNVLLLQKADMDPSQVLHKFH